LIDVIALLAYFIPVFYVFLLTIFIFLDKQPFILRFIFVFLLFELLRLFYLINPNKVFLMLIFYDLIIFELILNLSLIFTFHPFFYYNQL